MVVELNIYPDPDRDVAKIVYVNKAMKGVPDETVELVLNVGQWSDWTEVHFLKTPIGPSFGTMVRLYLQQVRPNIRLYVSPLNFIPTAPAAPFSEPADFVQEIGEEIGPFYTQGFAEEFNGLKNGIFTDEEYRVQAAYVLKERFRLLDYALENFEDGLLFFYFSSSDLQAHMFWWDSDEPHPVRTPEEARKYQGVVEDVYVEMDKALGKCMEALGDDATIIVIVSQGPEPVDIPDLTGMSTNQAESTLNNVGLLTVVSSQTVEVPISSGLLGNVADQTPNAGVTVEVGTEVTVMLGVATQVAVPNVEGMTVPDAQTAAANVGLNVDILGTVVTGDQALDGLVQSQDPAAATLVDEGSFVQLVIYLYQPDVPDFVGMTLPDAETLATSVGLGAVIQVGTLETADAGLVGTIESQVPLPGTSVATGTDIDVIIYIPAP